MTVVVWEMIPIDRLYLNTGFPASAAVWGDSRTFRRKSLAEGSRSIACPSSPFLSFHLPLPPSFPLCFLCAGKMWSLYSLTRRPVSSLTAMLYVGLVLNCKQNNLLFVWIFYHSNRLGANTSCMLFYAAFKSKQSTFNVRAQSTDAREWDHHINIHFDGNKQIQLRK